MLDQLFTALPRTPLQIAMPKGSDQQFPLVQPRRMGRREAGTPPTATTRPVRCRFPRRVAGVAVLNQEQPLQSAMPATKSRQGADVVLRVLAGLDGYLHPAAMNDKEQ